MTPVGIRLIAIPAFLAAVIFSFLQFPISGMIFFQLGLYLNLVALIVERT